MTRDHKPEVATEKRNDYAFWKVPNSEIVVTYSLPLFHEIDFAVNEGYRKIPHGGIEEGGLLFGKIDENSTRIEAFRPIRCEHASGPSLVFSDRDLETLTAQLVDAGADTALAGLEAVGWFLSHTRGPLVLTDREAELCDHYFARHGTLTVLAKPERFQPTRFGFLVREKDGSLPRDATQTAVILPLPGRNTRAANGPIASIPAPSFVAAAARGPIEAESREGSASEVTAAELRQVAETVPPPAFALADEIVQPRTAAKGIEDRAARRQRHLTLEQVAPKPEEAAAQPAIPAGPGNSLEAATTADVRTAADTELEPLRGDSALATSSPNALARRNEAREAAQGGDLLPDAYRQIELLNKKKPASTAARFVMVLPLAALLGCLVGYIAYLQVPSPIIPLTVKSRGETVVVTWPADQTRSAVYAAVRVDDSTPVMLTPEERSAGRVDVTASADMKVELIARNWIHDSRGIVRFIKPMANTAP
jgi:hypothetical protein